MLQTKLHTQIPQEFCEKRCCNAKREFADERQIQEVVYYPFVYGLRSNLTATLINSEKINCFGRFFNANDAIQVSISVTSRTVSI